MSDRTAQATADASPQEHVLGILLGFWQSRALAVAAELELADLLAKGPRHVDELAAETKTHAPSLFRLMRALESIGIFRQTERHVFANTPASECLRRTAPGSQWAFVVSTLRAGWGQYDAWVGLRGSVETGEIAFDKMFAQSFWEYVQERPEVWAVFNEAMRSVSSPMTPAVTAAFDWGRFPVIVDVGGGIGSQLADIVDNYPGIRGVLFDQPGVVANAIAHPRMERAGGSFFSEVPAGADAYILRWIIHDWSEPQARQILENIRKAMRPDSRLILIELVIPEGSEMNFGKWVDLQMLAVAGGRERTAVEYGDLLRQAGFELESIVPTASPLSLIFGKPV